MRVRATRASFLCVPVIFTGVLFWLSWAALPFWAVTLLAMVAGAFLIEALHALAPWFSDHLQRLAAAATVAGVFGLYLAYVSVEYTRSQLQPRLTGSGSVVIRSTPDRSRVQLIVINESPVPALSVAIHFEAVLKGREGTLYIGQLHLTDRLDSRGTSSAAAKIEGANATRSFYDMLVRAIQLQLNESYVPDAHGPVLVRAFLEYTDLAGYKYGGTDSSTRRRGPVRIELSTDAAN